MQAHKGDLPAEGQLGKERKEEEDRKEDGGLREESTYILAILYRTKCFNKSMFV